MDTPTANNLSSIHQFSVKALDGSTINLADYKGKKMLIVNTASECGYTPQYKDLETLYEKYKDRLVIIGFPANDFGSQEPGTNADIKSFCQKNYGVTFPMAEKITVKGDNAAPVYLWLTQKARNGVLDAVVKWNFNKFLLDENGKLMAKFDSGVMPMSTEITGKL
ncbi:MAG: glutathione peroxidase [Ferruginibacter sp.]